MGQHIRNWLLLCSMLFSSQLFAVTYVPIMVGDITIIIPIDDPPVAQSDNFSLEEDTATELNVLQNDTDENPSTLRVNVVQSTTSGTLTLASDNKTLTYTPNQDFHGADSFTYNLIDEELKTSDVVTATIQVNAVNDAPVASYDSYQILEDAATTNFALLSNDSDVDSSNLTLEILETNSVALFANRTLTVSSDAKSVDYQAPANANGEDWFTYRVMDESGAVSNAVRVTVNIIPQNDLPQVFALQATTNEDNAVLIAPSATDIDGDNLTFSVPTQSSNGVVTISNHQLLYTPHTNFHGNDSFSYVANDGTGDSAPATVSVVVNPVNDDPTILQQVSSLTVREDHPHIINIMEVVSDDDGDALFIERMDVNIGTLEPYNRTEFVYTPPPHYHNETNGEQIRASISVSDGQASVPLHWDISVTSEFDTPYFSNVSFTPGNHPETKERVMIVTIDITDEDNPGTWLWFPTILVYDENKNFIKEVPALDDIQGRVRGERGQTRRHNQTVGGLEDGYYHIKVRMRDVNDHSRPKITTPDFKTFYFHNSYGHYDVNVPPVAEDDMEADLGLGISGYDKELQVLQNDYDDNGEISIYSVVLTDSDYQALPPRAGRGIDLSISSDAKTVKASTDVCFDGDIYALYSVIDKDNATSEFARVNYTSHVYNAEAAGSPENFSVTPDELAWTGQSNSVAFSWSPVYQTGSGNPADYHYKLLLRGDNNEGIVIPSVTSDVYDQATGKFEFNYELQQPGQYFAYVATCEPGTFNCGCYGDAVPFVAYDLEARNFQALNSPIDEGDEAVLRWDSSGDTAEYELQVKRPSATAWEAILFDGASRTMNTQFSEALNQAGSHQYRVKVCYSGEPITGCGQFSSHVTIAVREDSATPETAPPNPENADAPSVPTIDVGLTPGQFRVDESGAATYSMPFELPRGIAGVTPSVGLSYSSIAGNGPVGMGWSITGLSEISRCRRTLEQDGAAGHIEFDTNDRFCLDGQKLIKITSDTNSTEYRTEIDNKARITAHGTESNPEYFTVERQDGSISYYGATKLATEPDVSPVISSSRGNLTWLLARVSDNMGKGINNANTNHILFNYQNYGTGSAIELLPETIVYSGNTVTFDWQSRTDTQTRYSHGVAFTTTQKLNNATISNHNRDAVRRYDLVWDSENSDIVARISSITEVGFNENGTEVSREPTSFAWYHQPTSGGFGNTQTNSSFGSHDIFTSFPVDMNNDGYVDAVTVTRSDNSYTVYISFNTDGVLQAPGNSKFHFTHEATEDNPVRIVPADINADGQPELAFAEGNAWKAWHPDSDSIVTLLTADTGRTKVRFHDINADALPDFLYEKNDEHRIVLNNGNGSFVTTKNIAALPTTLTGIGAGDISWQAVDANCAPTGAPELKVLDNVAIADFNGDGVADTLFKASVNLYCEGNSLNGDDKHVSFLVSASLKRDDSAQPSAYAYTDFIAHQNSLSRLLDNPADADVNFDSISVADLNNDGLTDIVYFSEQSSDNDKLYVTYGGRQSGELLADLDISFEDVRSLQVVDMNKDMRADIVYFDKNANQWIMLPQLSQNQFGDKDVLRSMSMDLPPPGYNTRSMFGLYASVSSQSDSELYDVPMLADWNGDGEPGLGFMDASAKTIRYYHDNYASAVASHRLWTITNGYGLVTEIQYKQLTDATVYTQGKGSDALNYGQGSPVFDLINPSFVVSQVSSQSVGYVESGGNYIQLRSPADGLTVQYTYEGLRAQAGGRGSLGFARITTEEDRDVITTTDYRQDFPYIGMPVKTVQSRHSVQMSWAENDYKVKVLNTAANNGNGTLFPYLYRSLEKQYGLTGQNNSWRHNASLLTVNDYQLYDSGNHANLDSVDVYHFTAASLSDTQTLADIATPDADNAFLHVSTDNSYADNKTNWWLGRVSDTTVTHTRKGSGAPVDTHVRNSAFTYNDDNGLLKTEKVAASDSTNQQLYLTTLHCYDSYGNKTGTVTHSKDFTPESCTAAAPQNLTEYQVYRQQNTTYDAQHRYITQVKNGGIVTQTIRAEDYSRHGSPKVVKNVDNQALNTWFDAFGQPFATSKATGERRLTERGFNGSLSEPDIGISYHVVEKISSASNDDSLQLAPMQYRYVDKLGRQVGTATMGFASNEFYVTQTYHDIYGRVLSTSTPFAIKDDVFEQHHKNQYIYDWTGRPTTVTSASGATTTMTYEQGGLVTTTEVNFSNHLNEAQDNQRRKDTRNILGETVAVLENEGQGGSTETAISYVYYATGELYQAGPTGARVTTTFDAYGRKTAMNDPDKGRWAYSYNALGELVTQTKQDSSGNSVVTTTFTRDLQGRTTERQTGTERTLYQYDSTQRHRLKTECFALSADTCDTTKPMKTYGYDGYGRQDTLTTTIGSEEVIRKTTFDAYGRIFQQFDDYNAKRGIRYHVNARGYPYLQEEARYSGNSTARLVYSDITAMNARGQAVNIRKNNGTVTTVNEWDAQTGLMQSAVTRAGQGIVQNNHYKYDQLGNMMTRSRFGLNRNTAFITYENDGRGEATINARSQAFDYDRLNRLTHISRPRHEADPDGSTLIKEHWASYDSRGNIHWKKDMGWYCYNSSPHAVTGIQDTACSGTQTPDYVYDDWGNQTGGGNRTVTYTDFDKADSITKNDKTTTFLYDTGRSRYERISDIESTQGSTATQQRTLYFGNIERIYENTGANGAWVLTETRRNLGGVLQTVHASGGETTQFLHKDNLGSINTITDENNRILQKLYFDPWGKKHLLPEYMWSSDAQANTAPTLANLNLITPRGFTGHEHVDHADIIHMNGRIYDPTLGRFLQADPFIQAPGNSQSYNRYSYIMNNPLSGTDPSGYLSLSDLNPFKAARKLRRNFIRGLSKVFGADLVNFVGSAATYAIGGPAAAAAWQYDFTRAMGGSRSSALRGAFTAYVSGQIGMSETLNGFEKFAYQTALDTAESVLFHEPRTGESSFSGGGDKVNVRATTNSTSRAIAPTIIAQLNASGAGDSSVTGGKFKSGMHSRAYKRAINVIPKNGERRGFWERLQVYGGFVGRFAYGETAQHSYMTDVSVGLLLDPKILRGSEYGEDLVRGLDMQVDLVAGGNLNGYGYGFSVGRGYEYGLIWEDSSVIAAGNVFNIETPLGGLTFFLDNQNNFNGFTIGGPSVGFSVSFGNAMSFGGSFSTRLKEYREDAY